MTPLAVLLALVCATFGTTSESADPHNSLADELYKETLLTHHKISHSHNRNMRHYEITRQKREVDPCEYFKYQDGKKTLTNPKVNATASSYSSNTTCFTVINALEGTVIELTFVDKFELEESMPKCEHDYLEIRDGKFGYATPVYKFCGKTFPPTITSLSPYLWLKFHSDDTLEYAGFKIEIDFPIKPSRPIHSSCYITPALTYGVYGVIGTQTDEYKRCKDESPGAIDVQWMIKTNSDRIYLNITEYKLAKPNECKHNIVQVFGSEPNFDHLIHSFCGSVASSLSTLTEAKEKGPTNVMYVRMFTTDRSSNFSAQFTGYRVLGADEKCDKIEEVDCLDGTCMHIGLKCDKIANCRLKADEDPEICKTQTESLLNEPETRNILIILSLILTGICSVLIFKCARKIYLDQKAIKENRAISCEERLDKLTDSAFMLDPGLLTREPEPRGSLDRENQNNEMVKQQRNRRKSTSSIESDWLDINGDWPNNQLIPAQETRTDRDEAIRIDLPKAKRDFSKKEESLRSNKSSKDEEQKLRDVAVEVPDALEAACQTRESLFQTEPVSSPGTTSSSNEQAYSDATIARLSPTVAKTSEITIELKMQPQQSSHSQDRRPKSTETTRSAPDVIIVSKPIC